MKEHNELGYTGIWMPRELIEDKRLTWTQRILISVIHSLDAANDWKGCYASNEYLAQICELNPSSLPVALSQIRKLGYIQDIAFNGRKRLIKVNWGNVYQNSQHLIYIKGCLKSKLKSDFNYNLSLPLTEIKVDNIVDNIVYNKPPISPLQGEGENLSNSNVGASGNGVEMTMNSQSKRRTKVLGERICYEDVELPYNDEAYRAAWREFCEHRKQIKKRLTPLSVKKLIKILSGLSREDGIAAIEQSITNGWQGIFPPKNKSTQSKRKLDKASGGESW
ncbi:MAG: helix-turn-helix domain-containing protein [Chthoniobacterales bacterium]|nr:helix-turn-helix domain-containing protein [Chthoniobacterales bacterium]